MADVFSLVYFISYTSGARVSWSFFQESVAELILLSTNRGWVEQLLLSELEGLWKSRVCSDNLTRWMRESHKQIFSSFILFCMGILNNYFLIYTLQKPQKFVIVLASSKYYVLLLQLNPLSLANLGYIHLDYL